MLRPRSALEKLAVSLATACLPTLFCVGVGFDASAQSKDAPSTALLDEAVQVLDTSETPRSVEQTALWATAATSAAGTPWDPWKGTAVKG